MKVFRGDIVLIDFPFSAGGKSKVRPVLIIQNDRLNERLYNVIVVMITSRTDRAKKEPSQLLIDLNTPAGEASGLLMNSVVNCTAIFTVSQKKILRKLGTLPVATMRQVNTCLRASLGM